MNATNAQNIKPSFIPNVIPRWSEGRGGVVILADEFTEDKVKAFVANSNQIIEISEEEYKHTDPVSLNDSRVLVDTFKSVMKIETVNIRARRPYTKQTHASIDKLAHDVSVPVEQQEVLQNMVKQKPLTKRQQASIERAKKDALQASVTSLNRISSGASEEQIKAATQDIGMKLAEMIAQMVLSSK